MPSHRRIAIACLAGLVVSLLAVGVESATFVRHLVQVIPALAAMAVAARRPAWGALAAIPIFLFWTIIAVLIWLYQLGVSRVVTGNFTPAEIVLTVFMAGFSIAGIAASARQVAAPTWSHRAVVVMVFTAVGAAQAAAVRMSYLVG